MGRVPPYEPKPPKNLVMRGAAWLVRQRPVTWFLVNPGNRIDPLLMRATGGRLRLTVVGPTVLLTHTGAKSGKKRTAPLAYFTDGDDVILIASRGGDVKHPAWYHNVMANPEIELWSRKGAGGRYRAREAEGDERERLWELATAFYPGYASYQERTDRRIPVIVCTPQDE